MQLKCKLVHPEAKLPIKATDGSAGMDFFAVSREHVWKFDYVEFDTGVAVEIPYGYVGLCFPRSSISNTQHTLTNCVGVIDADYRGTVKARFRNRPLLTPMENTSYAVGDRIIQMVVVPIVVATPVAVSELSTTDRNTGGFGSTGR